MNKHTPGPWGEKTVLVKGASWLATPHWDSEEARANARLIAAAPTMLEALYEARTQVEILQDRLGIEDHGSGTLSIINAAILEAIGDAD